MKKTINRFLGAMISLIMMLQLTACGSQDDKENQQESSKLMYKCSSAEINEGVKGNFESFDYYGGRIYFISANYPDEKENFSEYYLNSVDQDGSNLRSVKISEGDSTFICPPEFSSDGIGYYVQFCKTDDGHSYILKAIDSEGKETASTDISETVNKCSEDFYPNNICIDKSGNIYIFDYSTIIVFDKSCKFLYSISDINYYKNICMDRSGKVYVYIYGENGYELCGIDSENKCLESAVAFPFDVYNSTVISGNEDYDFFVNNGTELSGFNIGDEQGTSLLNWVNAGVSLMEVQYIFYTGKDSSGEFTFLSTGKSYPYEYPKVSALTKQLVNNNGKKEIILAGIDYSIDSFIENNVVKFNNVNEDYYITVKKYPWENSDQLNLDILSGHIPDILISDPLTPLDNYISKNIFTDLYEYMDDDEDINREDFVGNLLTACETDGKLYRFTDRFKVYTVLGKTSIFGEEMGITVNELKEITEQRPSGTEILPGSTKEDVLRFAMEMSGNEFIDYKTGKCNFNSESFIQLLEYSNGYMSSLDYDKYFDDSFWGRFETMYSDESALLMLTYLTDYADVFRFEHANFGEAVTAVGFPYDNRIGTSFVIDSSFSISEKSKVKDGAWEFVRTLLLPEHQDGCDCFPVRNDSLEKKATAAMKYDPERVNNAIVLMGQMMLSSGEYDFGEPKQEDIDHMNKIIGSASGIMSYDSSILDIIMEESGSYFNGDKSSQETAELIQSRVQLYLDEKS